MTEGTCSRSVASVVIPAHNEEKTIGRLLTSLTADMTEAEFDVVVVCNGCTDDTAAVSAGFSPSVRTVSIDRPSKQEALRVGDSASRTFPRIYVDADVELGTNDLRALVEELSAVQVLACSPQRYISHRGVKLLPRLYYEAWEQLPQVRAGLFGRGVIAISQAGHQRIAELPQVLSDDLVISEAFAPHERSIVAGSRVVVHPARTVRELVRRRVRVTTGNVQAEQHGLRGRAARTSATDLLRLAIRNRVMATRLPVFLAVTAASRWQSRRQVRAGDFTTWQRDESSRGATD